EWDRRQPGTEDRAQGLVWRGLMHSLARDYPRACACYRAALELAPDNVRARLCLVELLRWESPAEAATHLTELLRHDPDNARARYLLACARRDLGDPDEARRLFDAILAARPDDVPTLLDRGKLALDAGRAGEAEPWLRRAAALAPDEPEV